jgi:Protein of unknown function (DUF2934)
MPAPAPAKETPTERLSLEERIRRRAYELYLQRGNQPGSELDDWLQAEEEMLHPATRKARSERVKKYWADRKRKADYRASHQG